MIGIYKITNTITRQFYIGSSVNVKKRWKDHKKPSTWKNNKNKRLYQAFQMYGLSNFIFEILEECNVENLKEKEQAYIEVLQPTYNDRNAFGWDTEKKKECQKKYYNQLCIYNGKEITLNALRARFIKQGIPNPTEEAKKYLVA